MRFSKPLLCLLLAFGAVRAVMAQEASPFFHAGKVRALIFSGRNNHDWRTSTPHLEDLLTRTGHFDVRVVEEPAGTTAATLAAYEVIVLDYMGPRWGDATEHAVANFVKSGKGLVVVTARATRSRVSKSWATAISEPESNNRPGRNT